MELKIHHGHYQSINELNIAKLCFPKPATTAVLRPHRTTLLNNVFYSCQSNGILQELKFRIKMLPAG
ncbi:MAG: hypothetical protein ABR497_03305, partial [Kiritimatiellia bacterium]